MLVVRNPGAGLDKPIWSASIVCYGYIFYLLIPFYICVWAKVLLDVLLLQLIFHWTNFFRRPVLGCICKASGIVQRSSGQGWGWIGIDLSCPAPPAPFLLFCKRSIFRGGGQSFAKSASVDPPVPPYLVVCTLQCGFSKSSFVKIWIYEIFIYMWWCCRL